MVMQHLQDPFIKSKTNFYQVHGNCDQNNLPFARLKFYKCICQNILVNNIRSHKQVKNQ